MAYKGTGYELDLRWLYLASAAAMIGAFVFLRPKPVPPPENAVAFGCYVTPSSAPIKLAADGMTIMQEGFPRIGFHLERHKTGIVLTAEALIVARPDNGRYVYSIAQRGEGLYLDFFRIDGGRSYGVFDERELLQFNMLASDGVYLPYRRDVDSVCEEV